MTLGNDRMIRLQKLLAAAGLGSRRTIRAPRRCEARPPSRAAPLARATPLLQARGRGDHPARPAAAADGVRAAAPAAQRPLDRGRTTRREHLGAVALHHRRRAGPPANAPFSRGRARIPGARSRPPGTRGAAPARFDRIDAEAAGQAGNAGSHSRFRVVLHEGRNREVRRLWEAVGYEVGRLPRIRYGPVDLPRDLEPGAARRADAALIARLEHTVPDSGRTPGRPGRPPGAVSGVRQAPTEAGPGAAGEPAGRPIPADARPPSK